MSHTIDTGRPYTLHRLHERNYALLMRLIPGLENIRISAVSCGNTTDALHLTILERTKYTTTISLTGFLNAGGIRIPYPDMQIRIYHDASVAELLRHSGGTGLANIEPETEFRDIGVETLKKLNGFLTKWLTACMANGYCFDAEDSKEEIIKN